MFFSLVSLKTFIYKSPYNNNNSLFNLKELLSNDNEDIKNIEIKEIVNKQSSNNSNNNVNIINSIVLSDVKNINDKNNSAGKKIQEGQYSEKGRFAFNKKELIDDSNMINGIHQPEKIKINENANSGKFKNVKKPTNKSGQKQENSSKIQGGKGCPCFHCSII